jgi:protein tyrosine phosphatase (PTP) superfamily phosphohydrolase (DUF442 family)
MMTNKLALILCAVLATACTAGDEQDLSAVSRLKVDLGAVVKLGDVRPVDGVTAAGQPDEVGLKVFADKGYAAVIDLRSDSEDRGLDEPSVVEGLGMDYISLPVAGDGITFENARELDRLIKSYNEPVLVHCASSNRVGALLALSAFEETGDAALALEKGKAGGLKGLEGKVRELIGLN